MCFRQMPNKLLCLDETRLSYHTHWIKRCQFSRFGHRKNESIKLKFLICLSTKTRWLLVKLSGLNLISSWLRTQGMCSEFSSVTLQSSFLNMLHNSKENHSSYQSISRESTCTHFQYILLGCETQVALFVFVEESPPNSSFFCIIFSKDD